MNATTQSCISCGMPLRSADDHAVSDTSKPFCKFCGGADGELKSYDDVLAGMSQFLTRTQGLDRSAARDAAKAMMAKQPAWRDRP